MVCATAQCALHAQHVAEDSFVRRMFGVRAGLAHDARPDMLSMGRGDEAALRLRARRTHDAASGGSKAQHGLKGTAYSRDPVQVRERLLILLDMLAYIPVAGSRPTTPLQAHLPRMPSAIERRMGARARAGACRHPHPVPQPP